MLEALAGEIRQEKELERIHTEKEKVKFFLFADDMMLLLKDPKSATRNLKIIKNFNKLAGYKST